MWTKNQDVQVGFRKGRGTRDQIANIHWIIEKAREFQKNIYFYFIDYAQAFDCVDRNKLWKILNEMGIPDHFTYLLRNPYAGQEAMVRTRYGKQTGSKLGKEYNKAVYFHPAYLTYMQSTSWWAGWIIRWNKIAERNINNLKYADINALMAESEEELKSILMKVKEESEKAGLKLNLQKN